MYLPLLNYVVLDGLVVDFANIEDFTFVQRLHLSEDLVCMCSLNHNKMSCMCLPSLYHVYSWRGHLFIVTHGEAIYLLFTNTIRGPTLN